MQRDLGLQVILTHGHLENAILGTLSLRDVCLYVYVRVCVSTSLKTKCFHKCLLPLAKQTRNYWAYFQVLNMV